MYDRPKIRRGRPTYGQAHSPLLVRRLRSALVRLQRASKDAMHAWGNLDVSNVRSVQLRRRVEKLSNCVEVLAEAIDEQGQRVAVDLRGKCIELAAEKERTDRKARRALRAERKLAELEHEHRKLIEQKVLF